MKRKIKITITKTRRQTTIVQREAVEVLNPGGLCPVCGSEVETLPANKPPGILDKDVKCFVFPKSEN
jgi:hypothetical protein